MRLEFIGAAHEVTGSCHYLKVGEKHILVDCGMEPVSYTHLCSVLWIFMYGNIFREHRNK